MKKNSFTKGIDEVMESIDNNTPVISFKREPVSKEGSNDSNKTIPKKAKSVSKRVGKTGIKSQNSLWLLNISPNSAESFNKKFWNILQSSEFGKNAAYAQTPGNIEPFAGDKVIELHGINSGNIFAYSIRFYEIMEDNKSHNLLWAAKGKSNIALFDENNIDLAVNSFWKLTEEYLAENI